MDADGVVYMFAQSIEHPQIPPTKGYTTCLLTSMAVCQEEQGRLKLCHITGLDMTGYVPREPIRRGVAAYNVQGLHNAIESVELGDDKRLA